MIEFASAKKEKIMRGGGGNIKQSIILYQREICSKIVMQPIFYPNTNSHNSSIQLYLKLSQLK